MHAPPCTRRLLLFASMQTFRKISRHLETLPCTFGNHATGADRGHGGDMVLHSSCSRKHPPGILHDVEHSTT